MTTSTAIETYALKDALSVPLEAVMSDGDTPYVYRRAGTRTVRQEVETGAMNDDAVVIRRGLDAGDEVLLSPPDNREGLETVRLPGNGNVPKETRGDTSESAKPIPVKPGAPAPQGTGAARPPAPVAKS
jgi:hypothetical protein